MPATVGYSGTPLARKLGIKENSRVHLIGAPAEYARLVAPLPPGVTFQSKATASTDIAHVFVTREVDLVRHISALRKALRSDAAVWVSWPKKASGVATSVTEQTIRDVALPLGFVDVKVCAVDEVWSGLKLVVRTALR